jgi:hypothetical protein
MTEYEETLNRNFKETEGRLLYCSEVNEELRAEKNKAEAVWPDNRSRPAPRLARGLGESQPVWTQSLAHL